jgi:uncharacterized repeat protein (TIGR01451 family)
MARRRVRWRGAIVAALVVAGIGVIEGNGTLLLAATLPLAYLAYESVSTIEIPDGITVSRQIEPRIVPPGEPVDVTVTVQNNSEQTLSDIRVVDRVPSELAVLSGSPRSGDRLSPGETLTIEYSLIARRGEFDFSAPRLRVRGSGAGTVATVAWLDDGDEQLVCRLDADAPPLSDSGRERVGRLTTDEPGDGLTFHSTREYQYGDPAGRIDWRSYAKEGTLSTVNYDRQRAATVVFVLDARRAARVAAGPGRPPAVELGAYAITRAINTLLAAGHDIALAVTGIESDGPAGVVWLPPGTGSDQRASAIEILNNALDSEPEAVDIDRQCRKIGGLATQQAQFVFVSPMLDDAPVGVLNTWGGLGYDRTVLSPDIIASNTVSGKFETVKRRTRLARCQADGVRAIDWRRGTPLPTILETVFAVEPRRADAGVRPGGGH